MCTRTRDSKAGNSSLLTVLQVALGLSIAFSEGSVIEMKPAAPVPEDNVVSLKA